MLDAQVTDPRELVEQPPLMQRLLAVMHKKAFRSRVGGFRYLVFLFQW